MLSADNHHHLYKTILMMVLQCPCVVCSTSSATVPSKPPSPVSSLQATPVQASTTSRHLEMLLASKQAWLGWVKFGLVCLFVWLSLRPGKLMPLWFWSANKPLAARYYNSRFDDGVNIDASSDGTVVRPCSLQLFACLHLLACSSCLHSMLAS